MGFLSKLSRGIDKFSNELLVPTTGLGKLGAYLGAASGNDLGTASMAAMRDARAGGDDQLERQIKMAQLAKLLAPPQANPSDLEERVRYLDSFRPGLGGTYAENYAANGGGAPQIVTTPKGTFAIPRAAVTGGVPAMPKIGEVIDDPRRGGAGASPRSFPNPVRAGNIDLHARPIVKNRDGSISTVRSMSFGTDDGEVLIPTVSDDGRVLSDNDAIKLYERTGRHLGIFATPDDATAYAQSLHRDQAKEYGPRTLANPPMRLQNGVMTSGRRTPEGNTLVGGVPNSGHLRGTDVDYDGPNLPALLAEVQKLPGHQKSFIHKGHVHGRGNWNVPYFGRNGTKGLR